MPIDEWRQYVIKPGDGQEKKEALFTESAIDTPFKLLQLGLDKGIDNISCFNVIFSLFCFLDDCFVMDF